MKAARVLQLAPWNCLSLKLIPVLLMAAILPYTGSAQQSADDASSGLEFHAPAAADRLKYGKQWALVIGINYDGRKLENLQDRLALPALANAEKDAQAIYELLKSHYGYDDEHIQLLSGAAATNEAINREIGKLRDPQRVQDHDSVFVFFAGHGVRLDGEQFDRAAIFPHDVELSSGRPINGYIRLYSDLFAKLKASPARHKLVILDSCYSGEILKAGFHSTSEIEDRGAQELFEATAFQAIASCRAFEAAADGSSNPTAINSPFTTALLKGLQHLPARDGFQEGLWASRLFAYLHPELKSQSERQEPQFGVLVGDGEFRFFPKGDFAAWRPTLDEQKLLQAAVTSTTGNWWFDEAPWFIPSLRQAILSKVTQTRSPNGSSLISRDQLRDLARGVVSSNLRMSAPDSTRGSAASGPTTPPASDAFNLLALRSQHAKTLLDAEDTPRFKDELRRIAAELQSPSVAGRLEPSDIHFLAIVLHALDDRDSAAGFYAQAIEQYQRRDDKQLAGADKAMLALCRADYGEYLLRVQSASRDAVRMLRDADGTLGNEAPATFRIYILCREADAWLSLNRWAEADERLLEARHLAETFDSAHHLAAFVYRELAWARMIQWEIDKAEHWFSMSNRVLSASFHERSGGSASTTPAAAVEAEPGAGQPASDNAVARRLVSPDERFRVDESFRYWDSYDAKIAYLHNLHGLAMVQRFRGQSAYAAQKYRWIAQQVENAIVHLKRDGKSSESDAEKRLYERLVNTLERLGDCNLFGDPRTRDLQEALDDYRRAASRFHRMSKGKITSQRIQLLYKQALALSLPDTRVGSEAMAVQDTELALVICREADRLYEESYTNVAKDAMSDMEEDGKVRATGMLLALGELTTKMVALIHASKNEAPAEDASLAQARADLRGAIYDFRDENGPDFHRDQLEICLLASQTLLDKACEKDRFHAHEDAELLLSFCRLALAPHAQAPDAALHNAGYGDTRAYLRPYYDSVVRSKIRSPQLHVKDLLEVQSEATLGSVYVKPEKAAPTLALYVLDDCCYLLLDLPRGASKCVALGDDYELAEIRNACDASTKQLSLPREVIKELAAWSQKQRSEAPAFCVRWQDPVRNLGSSVKSISETKAGEQETNRAVERQIRTRFPFELPTPFAEPVAASATVEAQFGEYD